MPNVHDPLFALPAKPPFRWGMSPFRARGVLFKEEIAVAERALGGRALEAVRKTGDAAFLAFLQQRFSTLDWYDALPVVYFGALVARARGVSLDQHIRDIAMAHAERALTGFSGIVLRLVSTEAVATWLPRASGWYHDFGAAESRVIGERRVRGFRSGMPHFMVQGWALSAMYFTETVLLKSGARDPRAHPLGAEPDGMRDGYPLYRIGFEITWSQ